MPAERGEEQPVTHGQCSQTEQQLGCQCPVPCRGGLPARGAPSTLPDAEGRSLLTLHQPWGAGEMPSLLLQLPTGITDSSRTPDCSSQQVRCSHTHVVQFVEDRGAAPERAERRGRCERMSPLPLVLAAFCFHHAGSCLGLPSLLPCTAGNRKPRGAAAPTASFPAPRPRALQPPATELGPAPCRTTRSQRWWAENASSKPGRLEASPPGTLSSMHITLHPQRSGLPPLWPGQIKHINQLRYRIDKRDGEELHYSAWDPQPYLDSATSVEFIRGGRQDRHWDPIAQGG